MPYTPDPTNVAEPTEDRFVESAAAEFRAIKAAFMLSNRTVRVPVGETLSELPDAVARSLRLLGFNSSGDVSLNVPVSGSAADLALLLASYALSTEGAGMIGFARDLDPPYAPNTVGHELQQILDTGVSGGGIWVNVQDFMTQAQIDGVRGLGPLLDVTDAIEAAIQEVGDVTWQGSIAAQRPSAGGMRAGGTVGFPSGVYKINHTIWVPPHVRLTGQGGGGFFMPRPNNSTTADGNVQNVKSTLILTNFPAGSGVGQAGQMWVFATANWLADGVTRPPYKSCYSGAGDFDLGTISTCPGVEIDNILIDSVRTPATGFHIPDQIPYGAIRFQGGLNGRISNVHYEGVDFGILVNSSWGVTTEKVFGYSFLGGLALINSANASNFNQVYVNRDTTMEILGVPRTISAANRFDGIAAGAMGTASGFPEDFTNMRFGTFVQYPNGVSLDTVTCEIWDIAFGVNQSGSAALSVRNFYSEGTRIAPMATVSFVGTVNGFFEFSPGSRYGYCWGLNCSFLASGLLPRRIHCMPFSMDPNRNIQIAYGRPDLYRNVGGGKSANMITWSNDVTQGRTVAFMTTAAYTQSAPDGSFTAGTLTAAGGGISSFVKSGANIATITGTVVDFVDFQFDHSYCHWANFKAGTAPVTAIELAFSGGTARTVKAVITWTAGVPTLVLSGHSSVTGFPEYKGDGWYGINVSGDCGNNTTMIATVYIGDGTNIAAAGQTVHMGEHEVNPTAFPLFPIYNMSATVPVSRNPGLAGQGETWEWRTGLNYLGEERKRIRVAASGNPYALGMDVGSPLLGTYTTWDAAMQRISLSDVSDWDIIVKDGDTVVQTANNTSNLMKSKNILVNKEGAGANYTVSMIATPAGTASYLPVMGRSSFAMEDGTISMPVAATSDATVCGFLHLQGGNAGTDLHFGMRNSTAALSTSWCLIQQGFDSVNNLTTGFRNVTITGSGTAKIHAQSATPANSKTKVSQTSTGFTVPASVLAFGTSGYENMVPISTAIA